MAGVRRIINAAGMALVGAIIRFGLWAARVLSWLFGDWGDRR
jgi:hypothetical protein